MPVVEDVIRKMVGEFFRKHKNKVEWVEDISVSIAVGAIVYLILHIYFNPCFSGVLF